MKRCLVAQFEYQTLTAQSIYQTSNDLYPAAMGIIEHYLKISFTDTQKCTEGEGIKERLEDLVRLPPELTGHSCHNFVTGSRKEVCHR